MSVEEQSDPGPLDLLTKKMSFRRLVLLAAIVASLQPSTRASAESLDSKLDRCLEGVSLQELGFSCQDYFDMFSPYAERVV